MAPASGILARLLASSEPVRSIDRFQRVLDAIDAIGESIHSTLDPEIVMQRALAAAAEALGCDTAAISLLQDERWVVTYVVGFPDTTVGSVMVPAEEPHAVLAATTREPVAIDDAFADERVNREHMKQWGIRSVLVVPLLAGEAVLGALFLNYQRAAHPFDDLDLHFAARLASSLALALKNASLHGALRQELAERTLTEAKAARDLAALTRIHALSSRLMEAGKLQPLLQEIMDTAVAIAGAGKGTLQLIDRDSLRIVAARGHDQAFLDFFASAETRASVCGAALTRGSRVIVPDVETSPLFLGTPSLAILREAEVRAVQSTPMISRSGALLGILTTQWSAPYTPNEQELRRIDLLARQAADLIDMKQAEEALRKSEEMFRLAVKATNDAVWDIDLPTGTVRWNETYATLYGRPPETAASWQWWIDHVHPDDRERAVGSLIAALSGTASSWSCEYRFRRVDGDWADVSDRSLIARAADGRAWRIIGAMRDQTASKRAEQSLRDANAQLADDDRRKDEFIAILSHELRNPLAPIRYALPVLQKAALPGAAESAVEVIERQVVHLTRLVDDLLDVSRIATGKIELRPEYVTVRTVVKHAVEAAAPAIARGGHSVRIDLPDDPVWVHGDPARLAQVVTNLLDNSAKYTPRGGQLEVRVSAENGQAAIHVRDNGIGIPPDALATVFEMFHQVHRPDKVQGGLGIGLALVRRIVEMHGGRVEAHSAGTNLGSEFVVSLPLARDVEDQAAGSESPAACTNRLKVLVVDDNADLVAMLALFVESFGHDVRKAFDGPSALSAAVSYRPHVVLLDLGLPGMTGLEVARELRRRPETAATHLVALTGRGQTTDRQASSDAGFDAHLTKPTEPDVLEQLLRKIAETQQPGPAGL